MLELVHVGPRSLEVLSPKNMPLPDDTARRILEWIGVPLDRPLITQVSGFDPWKDPLGVIEAYRLARREVPGLQLALVGSMALDDPEGWTIYRSVKAERGGDPAIHLFTNLTGVGNLEVNAFQRLSAVAVQKSLREGFGLVVSEALWKGTPVVAGRAGGIALQMADGVGGLLVSSATGLNFPLLERAVGPTGRILGVDATDAMLARARRRVERERWGNVELVACDAAGFEFPCGVGGILSTFALTLVPEYDAVIAKGARALAPGTAAGAATAMSEGTALGTADDVTALLPQVRIEEVS